MGFRNISIFRNLKDYFSTNSLLIDPGKTSKLLTEQGFHPNQLYETDPSLHVDFSPLDSVVDFRMEEKQLLRFFKIPMSPAYLINNKLNNKFQVNRDLVNRLAKILDQKLIKPVCGVTFQTIVDQAKWNFYRTLDISCVPSEIQLNITNRCVNKCQTCRKYEWNQTDMPIGKVREVVEDLRRIGTRLIILSGGEPFLHRNINEILDMVEDMSTVALTSGCVPLSVDKLKKLKRIKFSVDALDPDIYRVIRGPGNVEVIKENVLKAKEAGCHVEIVPVIQRANVFHVPDIMDFCEKENILFLPSAVHSYDDLAFYDLSHRRLPSLCLVPFYYCLVDPAGDMFVCCHHHEDNTNYEKIDRGYILGNVFHERFTDIWFSENAKEIKLRLYKNRAAFCQGCYRYLLENDIASFVRTCDEQKALPYMYTYLFPLEIISQLRDLD